MAARPIHPLHPLGQLGGIVGMLGGPLGMAAGATIGNKIGHKIEDTKACLLASPYFAAKGLQSLVRGESYAQFRANIHAEFCRDFYQSADEFVG